MRRIPILFLTALAAVSCSASRALADGEYRLAKNEVHVSGGLSVSDISPYIRQQPNSYFVFDFNPLRPPVVYDRDMAEGSKENIAGHLSYLGYYSPSILISERFKRRKVIVRYDVDPGPRKRIDSLRFSLPEAGSFQSDFLADTLNSLVRCGEFLSEAMLEKEVARSLSVMRNLGYYSYVKGCIHFEADTLRVPGSATLEYSVSSDTPLEKYTFGDISISHPSSLPFRENVLRKYNVIHPGQTYSERRVNRTYSNLSQLRVFNSVNIETSPSEGNRVDCAINLGYSEIQGFKANLEGSVTSTGLIGVSPQLSYYHKNIFHGGEWLNLGFSGDFQFRPGTETRSTEFTVSSGLSFPHPLFRFDLNAAFNYQNRPEFTRNIYSGSFGLTGRLSRRFNYQLFPIQLNAVYLRNMSDDFETILSMNPLLVYSYSNHFDAGLGGTLAYSTNQDIVPKTSYTSFRFSFDTSGNLLGLFRNMLPMNEYDESIILGLPFSQYVKAELNFVRTIRFGVADENALAFRINGGIAHAYGNSFEVPYEKQFYVGGANSMRGWQARSVGPGDDEYISIFSIPSQAGDLKMECDLEFRFPIVWKVEGAMFAEVGNVWYTSGLEKYFYRNIASDWGLGLRLNLDFILLRLDLGLQIYDPSRRPEKNKWVGPDKWFSDNGFAVHFGVGYPF